MKKARSNTSVRALYFAEIQPIIRKRLMPIMLILAASFSVSSITGLFVAINAAHESLPELAYRIHWFNFIAMSLTVLGMAYGAYQLHQQRVHRAINLLLVTGTASIMSQAFINGGMGEPPLIIYPLMIMTAGFFSNIAMMRLVKWACSISIVVMYLLGVWGVTPPDMSEKDPIEVFMRFDQMIYCLLIIEVCFHTVKMFVNDYGTILSQLRADQKTLDFIANHDKLTSLPNRHSCEAHFDALFQSNAVDQGRDHLLLFVDIDNFKNINTRFGHNGGDEALSTVASRLAQVFVAENAVVSRIGGDEFIVMLSLPANDVERLLNKAMASLSKPLSIFEQTEYVTCSMGVVKIEVGTVSFKEAYRKADMAMNRAKKTGKNRYCYFNQAINDSTLKNIEIGAGLHEAIKNDEFALYYQAQVDLVSEKIVGAEALIRWITPDGQVISPEDFIPVAEKNGSIVAMTYWVIEQACQDCARWHAEGYGDLFVSVNVPSTVLAEGNLPHILQQACDQVGLRPRYLELELTESVILENNGDMQQQLQEIRDMGVSLAIDDFGTGYSNLSYLSRLNVQKLKVDQYFVKNLMRSEQDRTIVQAVAYIAQSFGMKTVAEGVETTSLITPLRELNCTLGQGYLWSKPVPLDAFMRLLNTRMLN